MARHVAEVEPVRCRSTFKSFYYRPFFTCDSCDFEGLVDPSVHEVEYGTRFLAASCPGCGVSREWAVLLEHEIEGCE